MVIPEFDTKAEAEPYIASCLDTRLKHMGMHGGSFDDARDEFVKGLVNGDTMPCFVCGDKTKVYHRHIYAANAACAVIMLRKSRARKEEAIRKGEELDPWLHVESEIVGPNGRRINGDARHLKHWGFIKEMPLLPPPHKKNHGFYRLLRSGSKYAAKKIKVRKKVVLWRGDPICFWGPFVGVKDALKDHFDYAELMGI